MINLLNQGTLDEFKKILNQSDFNPTIYDDFTKTYIYEIDGRIKGFLNYSLIYDRIELNYIYVDPKYRTNGIASKMMKFLVDVAIKNECYNITLEVSIDNINAINLYKKFGFEKATIRKNYYDGIDAILMIRKFDKNENNIYTRN